ncbi:MAG TPA: TonB family protein [Bacteroidota bacterium]|nr:TonB family protein [Bacteroidota bacterium]
MTGPYASTDPDRRNRVVSLAASIVIHTVLMIILSFVLVLKPRQPELIELDWGSTSGAPNQNITQTETDPNRRQESEPAAAARTESKLDLPVMKNPSEETIPATKKISKAASTGTSKAKTQGATAAETTPRRRRSTAGPAGGSGKSTGYSIDWAGSGTRRLLSGRLPQYPPGTDKEMPVLLQFIVLPDGSVSGIIPVVRSDELLEREAISALRTWRFDPLPPQFEQKVQTAKITFIFKLE